MFVAWHVGGQTLPVDVEQTNIIIEAPDYPTYKTLTNYTVPPSVAPLDTNISCVAEQGDPYNHNVTSDIVSVVFVGVYDLWYIIIYRYDKLHVDHNIECT